jgi:GNAT superfamily N-acetyltransferase
MIEVKALSDSHIEDAVSLASANYLLEQEKNDILNKYDYRDELTALMTDLFNKRMGVALFDNGEFVGYLGFEAVWDTHIPGIKACFAPIHGYAIKQGADRAKIASMLFQYASEKMLEHNAAFFNIKLYAHDKLVIASFVYNQFGMLCTDAIKKADTLTYEHTGSVCTFKEFTKIDISAHKEELLTLWRQLAHHLRQAPTYYPGLEFTDEMYLDYISDTETRLFTAEHNDSIIGIIDASKGGNSFINSDEKTVNIGDLFIRESYRGKNTAQELLRFACDKLKDEGYARIWVEHGTTNPNALRFWGKYFTPYTHTLTRQLDNEIFRICK